MTETSAPYQVTRVSNANEQYHARNRVSNSRLSVLKRSPREYKQRFIERSWVDEPNDAFLVGELVHCFCLEPEWCASRYAIAPKVDRRTTVGKAEFALFCEMATNKKVIEKKHYDQAQTLALRLGEHDLFRSIDWNPQRETVFVEHEIDFVFNDAECKAKLDYVDMARKLIVDIKTCQDASPGGFCKSVEAYGYHRQAAFYQEASRQCFGETFRFLFACVEKEPPHHIAVHELDSDAITVAYQELECLIDELKVRTERNNWEPEWSSGIVALSLSKWYKPNIYGVG